MHNRTKMVIGAVLALALVFGGVAAAFAAHAITLSVKPDRVMYPHKSNVTVGLDGFASAPATVTVQYRYVDGGDWKNWRTISASRSAEGTRVTLPATASILKGTTEFRAFESGVATSQVVTVTVLARLSRPHVSQLNGFGQAKGFRAFRTRERSVVSRSFTIRGQIWPAHPSGKDAVKLEFAKKDGANWVPQPEMTRMVKISRGRACDRHTKDFMSSWGTTLPVPSEGRWRVTASHEDTAHAMSSMVSEFAVR